MMKSGILMLLLASFSMIAQAGIPDVLKADKADFMYSLPETFGDTKVSFHVSSNQLAGLTVAYKDHNVRAQKELLKGISSPSWDSLTVAYEDVDGDEVIQHFSFCFYEESKLGTGKQPRFIVYYVYEEKIDRRVIDDFSSLMAGNCWPVLLSRRE
ncbi:hypothetical protein ACJJIR_03020 [Microbulbifer sp. SSSA008]|uniref:hypothetical protein n=1 Tax=Microbulbifer sp. SSSA008 TaxID=3243380 RepID=UPI00403A7854